MVKLISLFAVTDTDYKMFQDYDKKDRHLIATGTEKIIQYKKVQLYMKKSIS